MEVALAGAGAAIVVVLINSLAGLLVVVVAVDLVAVLVKNLVAALVVVVVVVVVAAFVGLGLSGSPWLSSQFSFLMILHINTSIFQCVNYIERKTALIPLVVIKIPISFSIINIITSV